MSREKKPTRCPECFGEMEYNRTLKCLACMRCGLTLTRQEWEDLKRQTREKYIDYSDPEKERRKKEKEWESWWLSKKED